MATISTMYLQKWLENEELHCHLPLLKRWATGLSHVTEMGTRNVTSTWGLLAAKPKKIVSIDWNHPLFAVPTEPLEDIRQLAASNNIEFEFIVGDTTQIEIEPTDLLFIDTWHTYEQLLLELLLHSGRVRHYIVAHDTNESHFPGMSCAIEDFSRLNPEWKIAEHHNDFPGITVLKRMGNGLVRWGNFDGDTLKKEIAYQHAIYYKECTTEKGPTGQEWLNYKQMIQQKYSDNKRWPKSHNIHDVLVVSYGNSLEGVSVRGKVTLN